MTVKNIIDQVERLYGRQPHAYILQLANDALLDVVAKKQQYTVDFRTNLVAGQRWYDIPPNTLDIIRVEILDTATTPRYNLIPKLTDPHKLLKSDTDSGVGEVS